MKNYNALHGNAFVNNFVKNASEKIPNNILEILTPTQINYYYAPMVDIYVPEGEKKTIYHALHCKVERYIVNATGQKKLVCDVMTSKSDLLAEGQEDKLTYLLASLRQNSKDFNSNVLALVDKYESALVKYTQALIISQEKMANIDGEYSRELCYLQLEDVLNKLDIAGLFVKSVVIDKTVAIDETVAIGKKKHAKNDSTQTSIDEEAETTESVA
jgi:hypothetical protein